MRNKIASICGWLALVPIAAIAYSSDMTVMKVACGILLLVVASFVLELLVMHRQYYDNESAELPFKFMLTCTFVITMCYLAYTRLSILGDCLTTIGFIAISLLLSRRNISRCESAKKAKPCEHTGLEETPWQDPVTENEFPLSMRRVKHARRKEVVRCCPFCGNTRIHSQAKYCVRCEEQLDKNQIS